MAKKRKKAAKPPRKASRPGPAKKPVPVSASRPAPAKGPAKAPPLPLPTVPESSPEPYFPPEPLLREMEKKFEMGLSRPKVSVVIACHNHVDALWHCLFALKTQAYAPHEIILVDNASEDSTLSFVRSNYPQVKILECQENFGPAMGLNLGIKMAKGHLIALLGPDMVVTPDWLGRMVKDFQKAWPRFGVLTAPVRQVQARPEERLTLNILGNPVEGFFHDPLELFSPGFGTVLFPRFLAPDGPLDADFYSPREGTYLGWKFRLAGRATVRSAEAKVFQRVEEDGEFPEWKSIYYETRNRWLNLLIFYEGGTLWKVAPWSFVEGLWRLAQSLATGFSAFWGTLCAMGWIGLHPRLIWKKRQMAQEKRRVPDREVLKYLSGRVCRDGGFFSRSLNFLSLIYCRLVGLEVLEWWE